MMEEPKGIAAGPDSTTRWRVVEDLFHRALALPVGERAEAIRGWCGSDAEMVGEVQALLEADASVERLLAAAPRVDLEDAWVGRVLGRYRLERELGRGGMGVVYLARRVGEKQVAAIKLVRRSLGSTPAIAQFLAERDALAGLEHPNVARLLDGGVTDEGVPYLVMEYVEGRRLDALADDPATSVETILALVRQLCDALGYVHRNLILHRDLKPGNVMVTADGRVKLLDFGTLKRVGAEASAMTEAGLRPLTLRYASPEQLGGRVVSTASDVYSLGVVLYRVLAGRLPEELESGSTEDYLRALEAGRIAGPGGRMTKPVSRDRATDLDAIVLKAMRYEPEARYRGPEAVDAELRRVLQNRPVDARGDVLGYKLAKAYQRHRVGAWIVLAAMLVLAVGLAWMAYEGHLARVERARAEQGVALELGLAHGLLFDYFTQLQQVPGSTDAQRKAVTQAVGYLDGLAATAPGAAVRLESVRAYTAMGTLLGSPYYQNLGDAPGAIRTLEKALPLAQGLVKEQPGNADNAKALAGVQMALAQVYMGSGKPRVALDYLVPASETSLRLANAPGADRKTLATAITSLGLLGDDYSQRGNGTMRDPAKATAIYEQVLALNLRILKVEPGDARSMRGAAIAYTKLGQLAEEVDVDRARAQYEQALQMLEAMSPADKLKGPVVRSFGTVRLSLIVLDIEAGRKAEADALIAYERDRSEHAIAADPLDARARFDLAAFDASLLDAYFAVGDRRAALTASERYLESAKLLVKLQPANKTWLETEASARLRHGKALVLAGRKAEGLAECEAGLTEILPLAEARDAQADVLGSAAEYLVYVKRDAGLAVSLWQRAIAASGEASSDQLLGLAEALRADGKTAESREAANRALAMLEKTPRGLGHEADLVQARGLLH